MEYIMFITESFWCLTSLLGYFFDILEYFRLFWSLLETLTFVEKGLSEFGVVWVGMDCFILAVWDVVVSGWKWFNIVWICFGVYRR